MKGYKINPDVEYAKTMIEGIIKNKGYCPCRIQKNESTVCPCEFFLNGEGCDCELFVKE